MRQYILVDFMVKPPWRGSKSAGLGMRQVE